MGDFGRGLAEALGELALKEEYDKFENKIAKNVAERVKHDGYDDDGAEKDSSERHPLIT